MAQWRSKIWHRGFALIQCDYQLNDTFACVCGAGSSAFRANCRQCSEIIASAPLANEVCGGFRPVGKLKLKSILKKAAGNDAAALEDELRLAAQEEHPDGQ